MGWPVRRRSLVHACPPLQPEPGALPAARSEPTRPATIRVRRQLANLERRSPGEFLDILLDAAFLVADLWQIVNNPLDGGNYVALLADAAFALIPFASGGGLAWRGFSTWIRGTKFEKTGATITRAVQFDRLGRVVDSAARVTTRTLNTGTDITDAARRWCCAGLGRYDASHIIGKALGGPGNRFSDNVVPILANVNRGPMAQVEKTIKAVVSTGRRVDVRVQLRYSDSTKIPSVVIYSYRVRRPGAPWITYRWANK